MKFFKLLFYNYLLCCCVVMLLGFLTAKANADVRLPSPFLHQEVMAPTEVVIPAPPTLSCSSRWLLPYGPFTLNGTYSDQFGLMLHARYGALFQEQYATVGGVWLGHDEQRVNATFGVKFGVDQHLKLTAEYLRQRLNFDFLSGAVTRSMSQMAGGGVYQILFHQRLLHAVSLGAYYSQAKGRHLQSKLFQRAKGWSFNDRRIAGSDGFGLSVSASFVPWRTGLLQAEIDYDDVRYHMLYEPARDPRGLGGTLGIEQLLGPSVKLRLLGSWRKPYDRYVLELAKLLPSAVGTRLELGLEASHVSGDIPTETENRVALHLVYRWGGCFASLHPTYQLSGSFTSQDFLDWVGEPAVFMPEVLVKRDQQVRQVLGSQAGGVGKQSSAQLTYYYKPEERVLIRVADLFQVSTSSTIQYRVSDLPKGLLYDSDRACIKGSFTRKQVGNDYQVVVVAQAVNKGGSAQKPSQGLESTQTLKLVVVDTPYCDVIPAQRRFVGVPIKKDQKINIERC